MKLQIKIKNFISVILAIIFSASFYILSGGALAFAAEPSYSDVLEDLQKDENFKASDYPAIPDNYSLQVIQIAESINGELFIYTYQPCQKTQFLVATGINMSLSESTAENKPYSLTLLNSQGVFCKYKVNDLTLSSATVRYYNITSIYRLFNSDFDNAPSEGQTVSEISFKVAQLWTVTTENGKLNYSMLTSEVITITQKYVGYCTYASGVELAWGVTDGITKAYFVAFSTDKQIDKLISADLTFYVSRAHCKICCNSSHKDHSLFYDFHDPEYIDFGTGVYNDKPLTIEHKQKFSVQDKPGLFSPSYKYTWDKIRKTEDFIADSLNKDYQVVSGVENNISGTEWVLNFYETQDKYKVDNVWLSFIPGVTLINGVSDGDCELNNIYDVSILRLEFETAGKTYNLGTVDNKQSGSVTIPFTPQINFWDKLTVWLSKLFGITLTRNQAIAIFWAVIAVVAVIALIIFSILFPAFGKVLWLIISAPFKGIAALVRRAKENRQKKAAKPSKQTGKKQIRRKSKGRKKTGKKK